MARARALVPVLQERAQRCEDQRRVPDETIQDFERAGLLRMCQPARFSATRWAGTRFATSANCSRPPAARRPGCSTSMPTTPCWSRPSRRRRRRRSGARNTTPSPPPRSIRPDARRASRAASCFPDGTALRAASIIADWLICGGRIVEKDGLDGPHFFLVPKSDAEVIDDWETMALEGTGSKTSSSPTSSSPASFPRRPPGAFRNRSGDCGQQGGGVSRAAFRRHGGGRVFSARGRHGARRVRGVARPYRTAHVAWNRHWRAARDADPRRPLGGRDRRRACALSADRAGRHAQDRGGRNGEQRRAPDRQAQHRLRRQLALKAGTRLFNAAGGVRST